MAVIAMTREMGTLGEDVVAGLAERLGLEVIQHGLVEHDIAENAGLPENKVHQFLEGEASLLERWRMDRRRMRCCTEQEIFELAAKGNVLIRGWGSVYLLRSVPHAFSVRVCAPMEFREAVVIEYWKQKTDEGRQRLGLKDLAQPRVPGKSQRATTQPRRAMHSECLGSTGPINGAYAQNLITIELYGPKVPVQ